jgi:hypothetical protein
MTARLYRLDETGVTPGKTFQNMEDALFVLETLRTCSFGHNYMVGNER